MPNDTASANAATALAHENSKSEAGGALAASPSRDSASSIGSRFARTFSTRPVAAMTLFMPMLTGATSTTLAGVRWSGPWRTISSPQLMSRVVSRP